MRTRAGFFMTKIYTKSPLTIAEQITLLETRGLIICDKAIAEHYLSFISYYRLSGYAMTFEENVGLPRNHQFKPGTTFEAIISLYNFDRLLRLLVMDAIERIEVAVRTQLCSQMALIHQDSHWYLQPDLFRPDYDHRKFIQDCLHEFTKSKELFIKHYRNRYHTPTLPPSWMLMELLSLGTWSRIYQNLKQRHYKKLISDQFKLSPIEFASCLHSLTYLRNLCAHHARLWNRHFTIRPQVFKGVEPYMASNDTLAAYAAMLHVLLEVVSPQSQWSTRLFQLIKSAPHIDEQIMGFKPKWEHEIFWKIVF